MVSSSASAAEAKQLHLHLHPLTVSQAGQGESTIVSNASNVSPSQSLLCLCASCAMRTLAHPYVTVGQVHGTGPERQGPR